MTRPSFFTLLLAVAIAQVLVASSPGVSALQGFVPAPQVARRAAHPDMNQRMIKKRRPQATGDPGDDTGIINVGGDPNQNQGSSTPVSSSTPPASSQSAQVSRTTTPATSSSTPANILASISAALNPSTTTTSSTTLSTQSTSSTSVTSASQTSAPPTSAAAASTSANRTGTVTVIASASDSSTALPAAQDPDNSNLPHSVIIGLIVAGSCIVGVAAIWTIIRKWKFSPSRHFEDRLEPITWEPTQSSGVDHDPTAAALARTASRNGSHRPHSYASNDEMSSAQQDPVSMAPDFPPAHDFTAGPAGASGYVDMHRGASPAPEAYGAGGYAGGRYETPNPYDAYDYGNSGYGQRRY